MGLPAARCQRWAALLALGAGLIFLAPPLLAGGVNVVSTELLDNGDGDGFADTFETASLRLTVQNTTGLDLHDVVLQLSSSSPVVACISRPIVYLGNLADGETRQTDGAFVFSIGSTDRTDLGLDRYAALEADFNVRVVADEINELATGSAPGTISLSLDLDATGGSGRTSFLENFDSGTMGTFSNVNLDAGRSSLTDSDGYRCQYADPDYHIWTYGQFTDCYLGATAAQADATFWQVDRPGPSPGSGSRGFSGDSSLYYGIELAPPLGHTTPLATLEAAATTEPINLAWARVCESDGLTECIDEFDCPVGDRCVAVSPILSIKQQVDLMDSRTVNAPPGEAPDRGVVQLQLADDLGQPISHWIKLQPYLNVYDQTAVDNYYNCTFDPVDDGNTEDDVLDPDAVGFNRRGPSSTCNPERNFTYLGDTDRPYDPIELGNADGPGLAGATGLGTWVESKFNLERFKGRRIRLRFLATSLKAGTWETWESLFTYNPAPGDDGWWIDDVTITDTLTTPAMLSVDTAANTALPGFDDGDGDGQLDLCDVCPDFADPGQADVDGDGIGDPCDNCPQQVNVDQADNDLDGLGDPCDPCPDGDGADFDLDSVPCADDNCPLVPNSDQADLDGDLSGDACDACPADPHNDVDGDGLCEDVDNCSIGYNPEQTEVVRASGPLQRGGDVRDAQTSADSRVLVYLADQDLDDVFELYGLSIGGGLPLRLSGETVAGRDVIDFLISPDGRHVVYKTDQDADPVPELYSAPISGGLPVELSTGLEPDESVTDFSISPDGQHVVYETRRTGMYYSDVYSIPITGGPPVRLNEGTSGRGPFSISPDSTRVVFGNGGPLYSTPILSNSPILLSNRSVGVQISSDSQRVVYTMKDYTTPWFEELYVTPITGGPSTRISGDLMFDGWVHEFFLISPDDQHVVYLADLDTAQVYELYSVPLAGGPTTKISGDLASGGDLYPIFLIGSDSRRVIFLAEVGANGAHELLSTPITGGIPIKLNAPLVPGGSVDERLTVGTVQITPDGQRVIYLADQDTDETFELFSVAIAGGTPTKLNAPLLPEGDVVEFQLTRDGSTVVYLADQDTDETFQVYAVPVEGGAAVRMNDPLVQGGSVSAMTIGPDSSTVAYIADAVVIDRQELFAAALEADPDEDGALWFCDTCPDVSNVDQSADTDYDQDGLPCIDDNCPMVANADQADQNSDGLGDACDPCPDDSTGDVDGDLVCGLVDNCPTVPNPTQTNADGDAWGDACDNCPDSPNPTQADVDDDSIGDACDNCLWTPNPDQLNGDLAVVEQWAVSATASSEWSATDWSASQATGPPELAGCESVATNWSPLDGGPDPEWLELAYGSPVPAIGVDVEQSGYDPAYVDRIELRDVDGNLHTVWELSDATECGGVLSPRWTATRQLIDSVIVHTAVDGWEEIDAVKLVGAGGPAPDDKGNACDLCPFVTESSQSDRDGDGFGDACDCAPDDPTTHPAAEVLGVTATKPAPNSVGFDWPVTPSADSYSVTRVLISAIGADHYGDCAVPAQTTLTYEDGELPPAGDGFAYLIRGSNPLCGNGTLGAGRDGLERRNLSLESCP